MSDALLSWVKKLDDLVAELTKRVAAIEGSPTRRALDGAGVAPEGGVYKIEWVDADTIRLTPRQ